MLKRVLLGLAALLALAGPALALTPAQRAVVLAPPPPPASIDYTKGYYAEKGATYSSFTAMPGVSFSRSSIKYAQKVDGTLVQFSSGQPAITDQGLSAELSATNLQVQSQTYTVAEWTKEGTTIGASATAPDGTSTATFVAEDTSTGKHDVGGASKAVTSGVATTVSVYEKAGTRSFGMLRNGYESDSGIVANLTTCTWTSTFGTMVSSYNVQALANGWCRLSATFTTSSTSAGMAFGPSATGTSNNSYTGDGSSGIYAWGAQLEQNSSSSSYIPTTTASATRAADTCSLTYSPNGSKASVTYTGGSGTISPSSPINLCASSGGAWVGKYLKTVVVKH